jgi:hypothetical protein
MLPQLALGFLGNAADQALQIDEGFVGAHFLDAALISGWRCASMWRSISAPDVAGTSNTYE